MVINMLLQFKVKNYKVFRNETILDLTTTQEKSHMDSLLEVNGNKILPLVEINGANASGKSSLLEAIRLMFYIITNSNRFDVNIDLPYYPYLFETKARKDNTEYEISICLGDYEYRYGFSMNNKKINEEWLYMRKFLSSTISSEKYIFERYNEDVNFTKKYNKYKKIWNLFKSDSNLSTDKMLILTTIASKEENGLFRDILDFISKAEFREDTLFRKPSVEILSNNHKLFNKFNKIISEFDPCLLGINIEEVDKDSKKVSIQGVHKNIDDDSTFLLPFDQESDGTIKIFGIMPLILKNLELGGIICIDELDTQLHPLLFKKIVNMYKDKSLNKQNAQLIYTAHSTFMFNSENLRRDQLYLVDKDEEGKAKLYSLSEFRNLRVDADYAKRYLAGEFGGIPYNK